MRTLLTSSLLLTAGLTLAAQSVPGLTGTWHSSQYGFTMVLVLNANGTGEFDEEPITFRVKGNTLSVIEDGDVSHYTFALNGASLTLSGGDLDRPMVFARAGTRDTAGGANAESAAAAARPGAARPPAAGGVEPGLVGKWCYFNSVTANAGGGRMTEECITLNGDGTYQYYNASSASAYAPGISGGTASQGHDSGRWTATDTTITARSRSGQTTSYELQKRNNKNNDPMVCLDGRCFATAYPKAPWQ